MKIITIDREYAAGGHTVGRALAKKLGVEIYDKDIIKHAAKKSGIEQGLVEDDEERISKVGAFLKAISPIAYDDKDTIFTYESQAIIELAKKGPCVVLSVFLHADEETRVERACTVLGTDDRAAARHELRRIDVMRQSYLSYYVERKQWHDVREYTLSLDTHKLSNDACVDIICAAYNDHKE